MGASQQQDTGIVAIAITVAAIALCCFGTLIVAGAGATAVGALTHSLAYILPAVVLLFVVIGFLAYRRWKKRQQ